MDTKLDQVRASLIEKIQSSTDLALLRQILLEFDDRNAKVTLPMPQEEYRLRTREGLRSAKGDRRYSLEEVRQRFASGGTPS